jgi:hypothetical protein
LLAALSVLGAICAMPVIPETVQRTWEDITADTDRDLLQWVGTADWPRQLVTIRRRPCHCFADVLPDRCPEAATNRQRAG